MSTLLRLDELLRPAPLDAVPAWWANLPVIGRARGRWVFEEPHALPHPRQLARHETAADGVPTVAIEEELVERHNRSSIFRALQGSQLDEWKACCLKTTSQEANCHVPSPGVKNPARVWMKVVSKSHGGLLRAGALEVIERWQATSTARQRAALSELLWSLQDHLTASRGRTESQSAFGPKGVPSDPRKSVVIVNPFHSSLFQASSTPIVPLVHRKMEQKQRDAEAAMLAGAAEAKALKAARRALRTGGEAKDSIETLKSKSERRAWPRTAGLCTAPRPHRPPR